MILPPEMLLLLEASAPTFTRASCCRSIILLVAILTQGRHTVANPLRTLGPPATGHRTGYQRVPSRAPWSGLGLGCAPAALILALLRPSDTVTLVGDDTVDAHPGKEVYGKARHRDPVRSSRAYTAWKYGRRWVVLAVLVRSPGPTGPGSCPSSSISTAPRRTTAGGAGRIARPRG